MKGIWVAGTDTEAGKTITSACLVAALKAHGMAVRYRKPVSTDGVAMDGRLVSPDALWVGQTLGLAETPAAMNPLCLVNALSPLAAIRLEDAGWTWDSVVEATSASMRGDGFLVCEGVGGLLVPLTPGRTALDLMAELPLPVVLAARPGLGTINHALLSIAALKSRSLTVLGFIFTGPEEPLPGQAQAQALNSQLIAEFSGAPFLGSLPRLATMDAAGLAAAGASLDLAPLLAL